MPLLLADDLSGALDAGAPYCLRGWRVRLLLDAAQAGQAPAVDELRLVSTDSRNLQPEDAANKVGACLASFKNESLVFKKIDSTLRGPIAAELRAVLETSRPPLVVATPANPAAGRTVANGRLLINGQPVSVTEFARDPTWPVRTSNIIELLRRGGLDRVSLLPLASVRQGRENIRECLRMCMFAHEPVVVSDAETPADLTALVSTALAYESRTLFVGSGALATAVAEAIPAPAIPAPVSHLPKRGGDFVFLCGSKHPASHIQMEIFAARTGITLRKAVLGKFQPNTLAEQIVADLQARKVAAVLFSADDPNSPDAARELNESVGRVTEAVNATRAAAGWFVTGGDTARTLCVALGGDALELNTEIATGTVAAILNVPDRASHWIVTKPGGFGAEKLLPAVLDWWRSNG
jgi:uncharacterized protein YgbK (DUF1537 family)